MLSIRPSAYPWIKAIGVFSSWDTLDRNSLRMASICSFFSRSFFSSVLASFNSASACSSVSDNIFMLFPRTPTSSSVFTSYLAVKSSSDIRFAIFVSTVIGPRKRLLTKYITTNPISAATREIYRKNWFDSAALSVMLEKEARIKIWSPFLNVPAR